MEKIKAKNTFKHIGNELINEVRREIISTIENGYTSVKGGRTLIDIEQRGQDEWLAKLVASLLSNLSGLEKVFNDHRGENQFKGQIKAQIEGIAPNATSAKLTISGIDSIADEDITAMFWGGEITNSETGQTKAFNAHTTYNKEAMQKSADELRDYFISKLSSRFESIEDEIDTEIGEPTNA